MALPENALISVFHKEGITDFAAGLHEMDINLWSSGGTARVIKEAGLPVTDVKDLAGGSEMLDHRVVTIARPLYAGILADMDKPKHLQEIKDNDYPLIGLICTDPYPLEQAIARGDSEADIIETTDVGGPFMLHAGAKGRRIVLSRPDQRQPVLEWLREGQPDEENVLRTLAAVAEKEVERYVGWSAAYLAGLVEQTEPQSSYDTIFRQGLDSN